MHSWAAESQQPVSGCLAKDFKLVGTFVYSHSRRSMVRCRKESIWYEVFRVKMVLVTIERGWRGLGRFSRCFLEALLIIGLLPSLYLLSFSLLRTGDLLNLRRVRCVALTIRRAPGNCITVHGADESTLSKVVERLTTSIGIRTGRRDADSKSSSECKGGVGLPFVSDRAVVLEPHTKQTVLVVGDDGALESPIEENYIEGVLKLPEGSVIVMFLAARSSFQRVLLAKLIESNSWYVQLADDGFLSVSRQGNVYLSENIGELVQRHIPGRGEESQCSRFVRVDRDIQRPVLTTYFTGCPDPQGRAAAKNDSYELMRPWVDSVERHKLTGVVFHDNLSDWFVREFSNDNLVFVQVEVGDSLSVNDFRFSVWRDWLSVNRVEAVFFSDLFDVVINRDPFEILGAINVGLMMSHQGGRIGEKGFFLRNYERVYGSVPDSMVEERVLNAGVWGGRYGDVLRFLNLISYELELPFRPFNSNMPAFNYTAYQLIGRNCIWCEGFPLHSEFLKYEYDADVAFVHK